MEIRICSRHEWATREVDGTPYCPACFAEAAEKAGESGAMAALDLWAAHFDWHDSVRRSWCPLCTLDQVRAL